jgi:hypothetical protein
MKVLRPSCRVAVPAEDVARGTARASAVLAIACVLATTPAEAAAQRRDTSWVVNEAAVAAALRSPEALWAFAISPRTRWADRTAAVFRSYPAAWRNDLLERSVRTEGMEIYGRAPAPPRFLLPPSYLPRVYGALRELRRERALHTWGWRFRKPESWYYASDTVPPPPFTGNRRRTILGHPWTVPQSAEIEPYGFGESRHGPWPKHVETALSVLFDGFADTANAAQFYAGVARLPCADRADAQWLMGKTSFVANASRVVTPEVVGLWRNVALNPAWPRQSAWNDGVLAMMALSRGDDVFWMQQALYADLVGATHYDDLRRLVQRLSWLVPHAGGTATGSGPPHVAHLALARRVDALPDSVPHLVRATVANDLLARLDPAAPRLPVTNDSRRDREVFAAYRAWFAAHHAALARAAAAQEPHIAAARRRVEAVTTCRSAR